jgi:hypothetical protein
MTGDSVLGVARKVRNTKRRLTVTPLKGNADCDSCGGKTPAFEVGVGRITAQPPHIPIVEFQICVACVTALHRSMAESDPGA